MTRFVAGEEIGIAKLRKTYDDYAPSVLCLYLEEKPRAKREKRSFTIKHDLPSQEEYLRLKNQRYKISVENLIQDAYSEIESLAEEMREWFDNLPENLQGADKGCQIEEAADVLEGIDQISYPVDFEIETVFYDSLNCSSRSDRCSESASKLRHAADSIRDYLVDEDNEVSEKDRDDLESFADEIENQADEMEGVEFPGMYG